MQCKRASPFSAHLESGLAKILTSPFWLQRSFRASMLHVLIIHFGLDIDPSPFYKLHVQLTSIGQLQSARLDCLDLDD